MKHIPLTLASLALLALACNLTGQQAAPTVQPQSEKRCGDAVCDGPENAQTCPQDCATAASGGEDAASEAEASGNPPALPADGEVTYGYVYSVVTLDRKAGQGDCGIDPWYSPDCSVMAIWWDMHLQAFASTHVIIIPDGQERWVITNHEDVASKYGIQLAGGSGEYQTITFDPAVTNPECSGEIEGKPFHFQVMGTRENGFTELILSADPVEHAWGSCMQAGFDWETSHLLYGWAEAISGNPTDLRVEMGDSFRELPGQYTFLREIDTNPSPEKRDHVKAELGFLCTGDTTSGTAAPAPCPWE